MRLLFLEWIPSSTMGGQELGMLDVCTGLAARGHDVTLGYVSDGDLLDAYHSAGVRSIRLELYQPHKRRPLSSTVRFLRRLQEAVRLPLDAVIAHGYPSTPFGACLARAKGIPLLCHLRLDPPDGMGMLWRLGMQQVSRFLAVSKATAEEWIRRGAPPEIMDVVYEGLRTDKFVIANDRLETRAQLGVLPSEFLILSVGRVVPIKNLEGLLRAFAGILRREPNARLLIAGRPLLDTEARGAEYLAGLRKLSDELGVAPRVTWLGHRQDVPVLYRAADVVAQLSHREPFGRTVIESHMSGTPIVVSRGTGMAELLGDEFAHHAVDANDSSATADTFLSFKGWRERDPDLARRLRASASRFSSEAMTLDVEQSIVKALEAPWLRGGPPLRSFAQGAYVEGKPAKSRVASRPMSASAPV